MSIKVYTSILIKDNIEDNLYTLYNQNWMKKYFKKVAFKVIVKPKEVYASFNRHKTIKLD